VTGIKKISNAPNTPHVLTTGAGGEMEREKSVRAIKKGY
jgi:hypothetical protein